MRTGSPFFLRMQINAPSAFREEILKIALSQIGPLQARSECLDLCFLQDINNSEALIWEETWSCPEKLQERVASEDFKVMLSLVDMSTDLPKVTVSELVSVHGLEWIARQRGRPKK